MRLVDVADGVYFHGDIAILCDVMENVDDGWIELEMSPIMQKTRFMVLQVRLVFGLCLWERASDERLWDAEKMISSLKVLINFINEITSISC